MRGSSLVNGLAFYVPAEFAGILPVSPNAEDFAFEPFAFLGLRMVLGPGCIALDVGLSFGVMSMLMGLLVGERGLVHSFEPNPEAVSRARVLVSENQIEHRVRFHNVCVGEKSDGQVKFYLIPGFQSVASTRNAEILKFHENATPAMVEMVALDDLDLAPHCIKLDIEGGEHQALTGARRMLEARRPDLVIETHGMEIPGIGGSLAELCGDLGRLDYRLFDLRRGQPTTPAEYASDYDRQIGYLLASDRLREPAFVARLVREHAALAGQLE